MKVIRSNKWLRLIIYIFIVASTVYLPRNLGWTQSLEMFFYDSLIHLRPSEPIDERIVIVGLTEEDIEKIAQIPVSDNTLAELIEKIRKYNPRVIGMDLHRNVPTANGYSKLKSILQSTPQLVGVEKTNQGSFDSPAILPNPVLKQNGMSSASDLIVDSGDVVRRGYLYVSKNSLSSEQLPSFSLKVALQYLEKEGIEPTSSGDLEHYLKLGKAVFPRLKNNLEFYNREDIDNYQVIINFRSSKSEFKTISFSEILNNNIDPDLLKDKIVLIGASAFTLGDIFFTPYSRQVIDFKDEIFGVEIHATQTSQIISAALNDRTIIKLLPSGVESFWLLMWIVTPSFLLITKVKINSNLSNLLLSYSLINLWAFIAIILISYLFLISGYWIPTANPIIALTSSWLLGASYAEIVKEQQLAFLLKQKLGEKTKELKKIQEELIAKEKFKAYEQLSVKMAHEIRNHLNAVNVANDNCQYKLEELKQFLEENSFLFEDMYESADKSPQSIADYFENKFGKIERSINKISLILESILTENIPNQEQASLTKININELIERIVDESYWKTSIANETLNPRVELNYAFDLPELKIATVDLERVLVNLLSNACDSLSEKTLINSDYSPIITLTTSYSSSGIEIKVKDNGMGICEDNLDQIFAPFWTTKNSVDGVGVGLFFSRQRIEKYNGTIEVKSTEGEWAEFTITLPKV